ncbi:MAG TPA: FtsX-like permease family protein [Dissulfurispiraceae bacterium]|nr:FtsX-like permease family protein [Dissulfurispiraceae bacterium]
MLDRQRNIIDLTLSLLLRRKGRNAALVIVYTVIIFIVASSMFFAHAIRREAALVLAEAPDLIVQRQVLGRQFLVPVSYADRIRAMDGVVSVTGRLHADYFDPIFKANYTLIVPDDGQVSAGSAVVGNGLTRSGFAAEGGILPLKTFRGSLFSLRISEILSPELELLSSDLVLLSAADFGKLFGFPRGFVTDLVVTVTHPQEISAVAGEIRKVLPDTRPITRMDVLTTYEKVFAWSGGFLVVVLIGALVAFAIFFWDKIQGLSAEERREIGVLKALGWQTSDVVLVKVWEGVVITLSSFIGGLLLAYVHIFFASSFLFRPVLKAWAVLSPHYTPVPFIDPLQIGILFVISVLPYTAATVIPAWKAASADPDAVMRA